MPSINGISNEGMQPPSKARPRPNAPGWYDPTVAEADTATLLSTGRTASPLALDGLLALQESVEEVTAREPEQDRKARGHGRRLLGALGGLQRLMLSESDPTPVLRDLQSLMEAELEPATDPSLAAALAAIRMRVAVELARRGL
jgi:hypothetical protein